MTAALLAVPASASLAARVALVIGNQNYQNLPQLEKSDGDATAYTQLFHDKGFETVISRQDLSLEGIEQALTDFTAAIKPGDTAVFVYSGHGWSDGTQNYIVGVDAPKTGSQEYLKRISVPLRNGNDGIIDTINQTGASLKVAILDACRNNPFTPPAGTKSVGMARGFNAMQQVAPDGTFIVFSAAPGQEALDRLPDDSDPNGLFTRAFIPMLRQDRTLLSAIKTVQKTVHEEARANGFDQTPVYYDETLGDDACLSDSCAHVVVAPPKPDRDNADAGSGGDKGGESKSLLQGVAVAYFRRDADGTDVDDTLRGLSIAYSSPASSASDASNTLTCTPDIAVEDIRTVAFALLAHHVALHAIAPDIHDGASNRVTVQSYARFDDLPALTAADLGRLQRCPDIDDFSQSATGPLISSRATDQQVAAALTLDGGSSSDQPTQTPVNLGSFGSWTAWKASNANGMLCYVSSAPQSSTAQVAGRTPTHMIVIDRFGKTTVKNEVQALLGFTPASQTHPSASIDGTDYSMVTDGTAAWLSSISNEPPFVAGLQSGSQLVLSSRTTSGISVSDRYALSGFSSALYAMRKSCGPSVAAN